MDTLACLELLSEKCFRDQAARLNAAAAAPHLAPGSDVEVAQDDARALPQEMGG